MIGGFHINVEEVGGQMISLIQSTMDKPSSLSVFNGQREGFQRTRRSGIGEKDVHRFKSQSYKEGKIHTEC
jgi:hypothetical protein